jgi:hypothetical protein
VLGSSFFFATVSVGSKKILKENTHIDDHAIWIMASVGTAGLLIPAWGYWELPRMLTEPIAWHFVVWRIGLVSVLTASASRLVFTRPCLRCHPWPARLNPTGP